MRRADNNGALDNYFVDANEKYYLRSLGDDDRKDVADIKFVLHITHAASPTQKLNIELHQS